MAVSENTYGNPSVCAILHKPDEFARRSGMYPLAEAMGAHCVFYDFTWKRWQQTSWRLGHALRRAGIAYYGSTWNAIPPVWGEHRLARAFRAQPSPIVHFLWGEFASPRCAKPFRRSGGLIVGTFHASARRQPEVIRPRFRLDVFDLITLMSKTQEAYFLERGVAADRLVTILHGVDTGYYVPPERSRGPNTELRLLLVGSTERDHAFAAAVMNRLPAGCARLRVCTAREQQVHYCDMRNVDILPFLDEAAFLREYQDADLLFMPMLDCTANNAVLESMACGTPVMINSVGGVPEYVDPSCNQVLDRKSVDTWIQCVQHLAQHREIIENWRPRVRAWAERFAWSRVAQQYQRHFRRLAA